jgi:hypothetical protein
LPDTLFFLDDTGCQSPTYLVIKQGRLTDAGLSHLPPALVSLVLASTPTVTDGGLCGLPSTLRALALVNMEGITGPGLAAFFEAAPNLRHVVLDGRLAAALCMPNGGRTLTDWSLPSPSRNPTARVQGLRSCRTWGKWMTLARSDPSLSVGGNGASEPGHLFLKRIWCNVGHVPTGPQIVCSSQQRVHSCLVYKKAAPCEKSPFLVLFLSATSYCLAHRRRHGIPRYQRRTKMV